ncbi:MAG TPA: hypothetical protein VES73_01830 [Lamprocystis sp. (in: g-proteobacteria)]|nr:hypothetical protein [Lamprocystis sp. (in: g-proteobacteria)]
MITQRRTFRKYFAQAEIKAFREQVLVANMPSQRMDCMAIQALHLDYRVRLGGRTSNGEGSRPVAVGAPRPPPYRVGQNGENRRTKPAFV